MANQSEPLLVFYDLTGPKPWSPFCWHTRFALNYKGIPYKTTRMSCLDLPVTIERLLGADYAAKGLRATAPIIETLPTNIHTTSPQGLNDSIPIAKFLNQVFTPELGFKHLNGIEETEKYAKTLNVDIYWSAVLLWINEDICKHALRGDEMGQEYFRKSRETDGKCSLEEFIDVRGGGEENILAVMKIGFGSLRERMDKEDENGEPTYLDFWDAGVLKWIEAASPEKHEKLLGLYGDDTFTKLIKRTEKYASEQ